MVEVLNESQIKTTQSFNHIKTETNTDSESNENKKNISNEVDSENVENYLDKNKKQKNNKLLIFGGIFILVLIITQLTNTSSSSTSSSINACACSERWLTTPKSMMKSTDKWKYDECVRKYGGFAGANNACIKSK